MQKLKRFICILCVCLLFATCCFTVACKKTVNARLTNEQAFQKIKANALTACDVENYAESGFTVLLNESYGLDYTLNEEKTDLGATNAEGNAWANEDEKTAYIATLKSGFSSMKRESKSFEKRSYDIKNSIGYDIRKDYNNEKGEWETSYSELFQKDTDGKYYYYNFNNSGKTLVDVDYYMNSFDDDIVDVLNDFNDVEGETCEQFVERLKDMLLTEMVESRYSATATSDVKVEENEGVYTFTISLTLKLTLKEGETGDGTENIQQIYLVTVDFNDTDILGMGTTIKQSFDAVSPINDSEDSGKVVAGCVMTMASGYEYKKGYDATDCPALDESATYTDNGAMDISFSFYVDGEELKGIYFNAHCGDEVADLYEYSTIKNSFKTDAVWYLDEECTIPLTQTTWTARTTYIELYTTSESLKEGFVVVGVSNFSESYYNDNVIAKNEPVTYFFEIHEVSGNKVDSKYAYLNGARIESGADITYVEGQVNYLINIYKDVVDE